jgi:hypothetical protein
VNGRISRFRAGIASSASSEKRAAHVRFGSEADISHYAGDVRFTPESGHWNSVASCPLCAKSGHSGLNQWNEAMFNCNMIVAAPQKSMKKSRRLISGCGLM